MINTNVMRLDLVSDNYSGWLGHGNEYILFTPDHFDVVLNDMILPPVAMKLNLRQLAQWRFCDPDWVLSHFVKLYSL